MTLDGENFEMAVQHCLKRGKKPPSEVEEFLDPGESWYILTPSKIELIYSPLWGFNKKSVELK